MQELPGGETLSDVDRCDVSLTGTGRDEDALSRWLRNGKRKPLRGAP